MEAEDGEGEERKLRMVERRKELGRLGRLRGEMEAGDSERGVKNEDRTVDERKGGWEREEWQLKTGKGNGDSMRWETAKIKVEEGAG